MGTTVWQDLDTPINLQPLCSVCHLNVHKSQYSSVSEGQMSLF